MAILLTGGAGYIGSITNALLVKQKIPTVILDNFSTGHMGAFEKTPFVSGDLKNRRDIEKVFFKYDISAVIHFGALTLAGESMERPYEYYMTNVMGGLNLLETMRRNNCHHIVFSSSCSIFGAPDKLPVTEDTPKNPLSVYAETKYMFEQLLKRYDTIFGIKYVALRYFNASGASQNGIHGEDHFPETHIIPNAIFTALKKKPVFDLFGTDYKTPDGTCIRDYIHVEDLATAHVKALEYLKKNNVSDEFNLGSGKGYSNKEVIKMIEKISGAKIPVITHPRRPGDPDAIFADPGKAQKLLGWKAEHSDLATIIKNAWEWHTKHPQGYNTMYVGSS
jgi:UDP-glucose 4-epimerase